MSEENLVLVVEDNDFVRMQIVSYMTGAGYKVVEASEGRKALELMSSNDNIALAIVDVRMEPMGGFEFIKALRGKEIHKPIILVTGDQTADLLEMSGKLGVGAVLMKPVEKDRLVKTVDRILQSERRKR
jgi:CheY-like chemotaxis protein